jgi:Ca-activated chloride channel homolog
MRLEILSLLLVGLSALGCESAPPSRTQTAQTKHTVQVQQTAELQQSKGTPVWPYLSETKESKALASNLTEKNFILVFDGSGSMGDSNCGGGRPRIFPAKDAAIRWERSVPADANIGLIAFHSRGWTRIPPTRDRKAFEQAIYSIEAGGNTPLAVAFNSAFDYLTQQAQSQLGYGEYTIVTTTDGAADSIPELSRWVDHILKVSPIQIFTIGFCIAKNHTLYQPGRTTYRSAHSPEELEEGLKDVLAEAEDFSVQEFKR